MADCSQNVQRAKLAEQIERHRDMADSMKTVAEQQKELTTEERNLLSVAYKNVVGALRCAYRTLASIEHAGGEEILPEVTKYKEKIKAELNETCKEVQELLDKYLIPHAKDDDSKVFYWKMKGDYYRYQAEVADDKAPFIKESQEAYQKALTIAEKMPPTNPIRLGLALNFSVFYFEIANNRTEACNLAKKALAAASDDQDKCETFKDSKLIMQLLHDNLTLWEMDMSREGEGEQEQEQEQEPEQPAEN